MALQFRRFAENEMKRTVILDIKGSIVYHKRSKMREGGIGMQQCERMAFSGVLFSSSLMMYV